MNFVIFVISIFGIYCVCFLLNNSNVISQEKKFKGSVKITLNIYNVDYVQRKELISKLMCGNYENLLEIVDNIQINWL